MTDEDIEEQLERQTTRARLSQKPGSVGVEEILRGVTANWIAQALGMDVRTVRQKLADCPTIGRVSSGYTYSLKEAVKHLFGSESGKPNKILKAADLPAHLQDSFWSAALKRQKWEENAGDLWRTDDVLRVLGETFQTIKHRVQLWTDTIDSLDSLSLRQREIINQLSDALQNDIHESLVVQAAAGSTTPQLAEIDSMLESPKTETWADLV